MPGDGAYAARVADRRNDLRMLSVSLPGTSSTALKTAFMLSN